MAFGAVPGAIVGGRVGYALVHFDYYAASPAAVTDPSQGGFGLTLAVVLGTIAAVAVARLLAAPIGRWLGAVALPLLVGLGLGKLTMVLGGVGQGRYSDSALATSYTGGGPWGSANPAFSALPSQAIEGALILAVAVLVVVVPAVMRFRIKVTKREIDLYRAPRRDWLLLTGGRRYLTVLALWAVVRFAAEFTWRDAHVLGPFVADQIPLAAVIAVCLFGPAVVGDVRRLRRGVAGRVGARRAARRAARLAAKAARAEAETAEAERIAASAAATEDLGVEQTAADSGS
jgi:hypothetical protein